MRSLRPCFALLVVPLALFSACSEDEAPAPGPAASTSSTSSGGSSSGAPFDAQADVLGAPGDASASADADAAPEHCLTGGSAAAGVTGSGTCADPFVVDLTGSALGSIASHVAPGGADEADFVGPCAAQLSGTVRDLVYHVKLPGTAASLEIGVDAPDVRLGVADGTSCGQPVNACTDVATGTCRTLTATKGAMGFSGTETIVVVSEVSSSGQNLSVRFLPN